MIPLLLGLVLLLGGGSLGVLGVSGLLAATADEDLASAPGTIDEVTVTKRVRASRTSGQDTHEHLVVVLYRYQVDGQTYKNNQYAFDEPHEAFGTSQEARARAEKLQAKRGRDGALTVLYDPALPHRSILAKREGLPAMVACVGGGAAGLLGVFFLVSHARRRRRSTG